MVEIRRAEERDLAALLDLAQALLVEDALPRDPWVNPNWVAEEGDAAYRRTLAAPERTCFLAVDGATPIGFATCAVEEPTRWRPIRRAQLQTLYVAPAWRSQGIGERLVAAFREWATRENATLAYVVAFAPNERARRFYQRVGFVPYELVSEMELT